MPPARSVRKKKTAARKKAAVRRGTTPTRSARPNRSAPRKSAKKTARKPARKTVRKAARKTVRKTVRKTPARKAAKFISKKPAKPVARKAKAKPVKTPTRPVRPTSARPTPSRPTSARPPARPRAPSYVPSDDEKYMSHRQLRYFRGRLERMRDDITRGVRRTVTSMRESASSIPDDNDRASKESEFAVELRERDRDRRLQEKISRALAAIGVGDFGFCGECGDPIGVPRLLARPVATLCIECKDLRERQEKKRLL